MKFDKQDEVNEGWNESDEMLTIAEAFWKGKPVFPMKCPVCSAPSGHVYMNRYADTDRGGMWVWCSECRAYVHVSSTIPVWWKNLTDVNQKNLCAGNAEELEQHAMAIDQMVNDRLKNFCFF